MKNTKTMLVALLVMTIQWLLCGFFGYTLGNVPFNEALTHVGTFAYLTVLGWVPTLIVCSDYYCTLND